MAGEIEDPDATVARLEAALERIAALAGARPVARSATDDAAEGDAGPSVPIEEITARLDGLIDRLRAALSGSSSGGRPG